MILNIDGQKFLEVKNISYIGKYHYELAQYEEHEETLKGTVKIFLDYFTNLSEEMLNCELTFDFIIEKSGNQQVSYLNLKYLNSNVLDNQGISIEYQLELNIEEEEKSENLMDFDIIKEEIQDEIDSNLSSVLKREKESREEIEKSKIGHLKGMVTDTVGQIGETVNSAVGHVKDFVVDSAHYAKELVKDTAGFAKNITGSAVETVKDLVGNTSSHAKEIAGETMNFSKEVLKETTDFVKTSVTDPKSHVKGLITDTALNVTTMALESAEHIKGVLPSKKEVKDILEKGGEELKQIVSNTSKQIKDLAENTKNSFDIKKLKDKMTSYKIVFVKDENELEKISLENNISIEQIYRDNNYKIKDKVIIKGNE